MAQNYSNSKLATVTILSPNNSGIRNHVIDTITIHCMAGNSSVEGLGNWFKRKETQASSNYGIGSDGRIALYVPESNRSWCSSSSANDNRAVTIEVANDGGAPDWHVSDKALDALVNLVTDICKRNGIKQLLWRNDKSLIGQVTKQNMTLHKWFKSKECPGPYLISKHPVIAEEVNNRLAGKTPKSITNPPVNPYPCLVKVTASELNIRAEAGTNYKITGVIKDRGTYTIIAESKGTGATLWGKLKSGVGWISLDYVTKV